MVISFNMCYPKIWINVYCKRQNWRCVHSAWEFSRYSMYVGNIFSTVLPWPCAAVAAAHAGAAGRGSSRRPGPPEVSGSHNTPCRGPPCTCGESAGNLPYPAGRGGEKEMGWWDGGQRVKRGGCVCMKNVSERRIWLKNLCPCTVCCVCSVSDLCQAVCCLCVQLSDSGVRMFVQYSVSMFVSKSKTACVVKTSSTGNRKKHAKCFAFLPLSEINETGHSHQVKPPMSDLLLFMITFIIV